MALGRWLINCAAGTAATSVEFPQHAYPETLIVKLVYSLLTEPEKMKAQ